MTVGSFDQYWEGSQLRKNETIATVIKEDGHAYDGSRYSSMT